MIGVGAGQQSRVDCVKLAGRKVATWWLRQHPKVRGLAFASTAKRQARVNARVRYIEGDLTTAERPSFEANFATQPVPLTAAASADLCSSEQCLLRLAVWRCQAGTPPVAAHGTGRNYQL